MPKRHLGETSNHRGRRRQRPRIARPSGNRAPKRAEKRGNQTPEKGWKNGGSRHRDHRGGGRRGRPGGRRGHGAGCAASGTTQRDFPALFPALDSTFLAEIRGLTNRLSGREGWLRVLPGIHPGKRSACRQAAPAKSNLMSEWRREICQALDLCQKRSLEKPKTLAPFTSPLHPTYLPRPRGQHKESSLCARPCARLSGRARNPSLSICSLSTLYTLSKLLSI